jgi:hypothetical protein
MQQTPNATRAPALKPISPRKAKQLASEQAKRLADGRDVTVALSVGTLTLVSPHEVRGYLTARKELRVIPRTVYDAHVTLCKCHGDLLAAVERKGRRWAVTYYVEG